MKKNRGLIIGITITVVLIIVMCLSIALNNRDNISDSGGGTQASQTTETNESSELKDTETESSTQEETEVTSTEIETETATESETESKSETETATESESTSEEPSDTEEPHVHSYTESVTAATCTKDGKKVYSCSCGESYSETLKATGHKYGEYKYNNDATYKKDGTKTATCSNCGGKDTKTASGTKLSYTFTEMNKTMWAKSSVNVRDLPSTDGSKIGSISKNQDVTVTGQCKETNWYRIEYNGSVAYVSNNYLTSTEPEDSSVNDKPSGVTYTAEDKVGDGLDDYRVGLHKYTDDGKYQCYVWMDVVLSGKHYYGFFVNLSDYDGGALEELAWACESALRDSSYWLGEYMGTSHGGEIPTNAYLRFNYDITPNKTYLSNSYDMLAIKDYDYVNDLTTGMIIEVEIDGVLTKAWTNRPEPITEKEACAEAGITYERYLECKEIAQSYGYE